MAATMSFPPHSGNGMGGSAYDEVSSSAATPAMPLLALPSTSQPPYPAPADVHYPDNSVLNPHVSSMQRQPIFSNLPAGSLFRPERLPADMDIRLEKSSVWMGLDKATHKAVYFLPPQCKQCLSTGHVVAHCDRGYPSCQRCCLKGTPCEPGTKWSQMRQKVKPRKSGESVGAALTADNLARVAEEEEAAENRSRLSAAQKGKGRAVVNISPAMGLPAIDPDHFDIEDMDDGIARDQYPRLPSLSPDAGGRGKRTKKKRRLSLDEEIDPELLDDDGNLLPPKPKRRKSPSKPPPTDTEAPAVTWEADTEILSEELRQDAEYFARLDKNSRKPPLKNMRAACPAWATTRRALQSGAEYFRGPTKIEGGSVEVGVGGVARGVILEGKSVGGGNYWGTKAAAGSMVLSLGSARERRVSTEPPPDAPPSRDHTTPSNAAGSSLPRINVLPTTIHIESDGRSPIYPTGPWAEEPEIEALLMAQRARVPMAMAVAQDYLEPPFKVPRAFVVLGWFWLTDAWLEPENLWEAGTSKSKRFTPENINLVRWKFRFEWCRGHQGVPWWSPNDDPARPPTPFIEYKFVIEPLAISGPGISGSSTVIHPSKRAVSDHRAECGKCGMVSEAVYRDAKVCLNEGCEMFFMPVGGSGTNAVLDPISKTPCLLRPVQRKVPEFLGLRLRGYDPHVASEEGSERGKLGSAFWQGWVCGKCGMANERRKWSGWDCEGCKHHIGPARKPVTPLQLLNPLHPGIKTSGAPRPDIGHPVFPPSFKTTTGFTVYEHHIKVVKHAIEYEGTRTEVYHALHARRDNVVDVASRVWREMQGEGGEDRKGSMGPVLRRGMLSSVSKRPAERHLSAFYTLACGPAALVRCTGFPAVLEAVSWAQAPAACLDAMDLINFRAGCMFPGFAERFNSLILAVTPPPTLGAAPPTISLQAGEYLSILILGSEGTISFRPLSEPSIIEDSAKGVSSYSDIQAGTMVMQHGDVLGVLAEAGGLEISIKMDGFGMVCFGQQVYSTGTEPGLGAFVTTSDREPGSADPDPAHSKGVLGDIDINALPPPPVKSKVFIPAPLTDWYIGPRPLDVNQPMRIRRPIRALPGAVAARKRAEEDEEMAGNGDVDMLDLGDGGGVVPFVEFEVDPAQATGYIVVDDLPDVDAGEGPRSPRLLVCEIPPSPTITPAAAVTKRRGPAAGGSKAAKAAMAAADDGEEASTPAEPRKKRKYVFKNKPLAAEVEDDGGEGGSAPATPASSVVKPKAKPRAKAQARSKRVSDIGQGGEDGIGEGSSPAGSSTIGTIGAGMVDSPMRGVPESPAKPKRRSGGSGSRAPRKSAPVDIMALGAWDEGEVGEGEVVIVSPRERMALPLPLVPMPLPLAVPLGDGRRKSKGGRPRKSQALGQDAPGQGAGVGGGEEGEGVIVARV